MSSRTRFHGHLNMHCAQLGYSISMLTVLTLPEEPCYRIAGPRFVFSTRVHFMSYQSFLSGPACASSKYSTIPILHIFYSITSGLVMILLYVNLAYTNPIWIPRTYDAVSKQSDRPQGLDQ